MDIRVGTACDASEELRASRSSLSASEEPSVEYVEELERPLPSPVILAGSVVQYNMEHCYHVAGVGGTVEGVKKKSRKELVDENTTVKT